MPASVTPMMSQYLRLKEKYGDCLLFFRLGDFYEMFFEDALTASRELEIVLTGRDCGLEERAPMCGVPYHAVDSYIAKLIDKGYKVALCEQLTDPALSKGLVERDVVRIYTAGTVIEESMLDERANNYIVSLYYFDNGIGLACADVSTGGFTVMEFQGGDILQQLMDELVRISPNEIIANDSLFVQESIVKRIQAAYRIQCEDGRTFDPAKAEARLMRHFSVSTLAPFGCDKMTLAVPAAGALMAYLEETQKNALSHIRKIGVARRSLYMALDAATRRNLELTKPLHFEGNKRSTLLYLLDKTATSMGARLLRAWIEQPLQNIDEIEARLDAVGELVSGMQAREALRGALDSIYDIERLCSRIAYGTVNARDCVSLRVSLSKLPEVMELTGKLQSAAYLRIASRLDAMEDVHTLLDTAIVDEPPAGVKDGGIIKTGYDAEVDALREASANGKDWLARMEADERAATGIKNLKIGYNRVFGYYIEVTKSYQHLVPYNYQRKQTLAGSERYVTPELKELEETITGAEERLIQLEYELFARIRETLAVCIERLQNDAALVAELDAYASLAKTAFDNEYCRPKMLANGSISITDGRHPIVERGVKDGFVPNNTQLDQKDNRLLILTGPNMAGKSTYLRQVALIVLMAHLGSFVPAKKASISVVDRIFTRIGASDNLASGQSTFMVEMSEVASILNNATQRSLLILDEIGRGTSTFDGLSIAWAVLEYIADPARCGAKALFATHYHELTELEGRLPGIKNYRISVKEVGDDIIFLRRIVRGSADKSFGVQVARLAGLPGDVIARAKELLSQLEAADINRDIIDNCRKDREDEQQLTLFGSPKADDIVETLRSLDVNALTPMEALNMLYDLHMRAKLKD
ncbi:MAG TPA: DNA mismatch repair protein MutS [Clostridia bacterium]|nr:DNA mismatch repair protein MutS [Clostridia bacterium]